jgi:Flp pilus assembly protein TadD
MTPKPAPGPWSAAPRRLSSLLLVLATLGGVGLGMLGGCASPPPVERVESLWLDEAYPAPAQPLPSAETLFALDAEMRAFADKAFSALNPLHDRREALLDALYRNDHAHRLGLKLQYDATITRTASEAFAARAGNCLSLVMMTSAFAQHLGLLVTYQDVRTELQYTHQGSLTVASGHVNLVLGPRPSGGTITFRDNRVLVVDFLPPADTRGQRATPLEQPTIVAMYFNNRAAELLAGGHVDEAYWHAREALRHDPRFLHAYNTLGVVHERAGHAAAAEAAFRRVLAVDTNSVAALGNLVRMLAAQGRATEAAPLATRLATLQPEAPLHHYRQGLAAMAAGNFQTAVVHFRRELQRQPLADEVHLALGQALHQLGDAGGARHHLARAVEYGRSRNDRVRYQQKLAALKAARHSAPPAPLPAGGERLFQ